MPTLSIIVPAYNVEKYVEDCIRSIMASTYTDFEVLLIDDGSTDNTGAICDRLAQEFPKIRVFHTENGGVSKARNLGLDHAQGKYIGFVDSDDKVSPKMFDALVNAMSEDIQLVACRYLRCAREDIVDAEGNIQTASVSQQREAVERVLGGGYGPIVWGRIYDCDVLLRHNIRFRDNCRASEDVYFTSEYLTHCQKVAFITERLYFYLLNDSSIQGTFRNKRTVGAHYQDAPRSWVYAEQALQGISNAAVMWSQARAAMYYQTILRKLEKPDPEYIKEAVAYVKKNKKALLECGWGFKYYLSALVLCMGYPLWAAIFRRGLK